MTDPIGHMCDFVIRETHFQEETVQVSESGRLLSRLKSDRQKLLSRKLSGNIPGQLYDK